MHNLSLKIAKFNNWLANFVKLNNWLLRTDSSPLLVLQGQSTLFQSAVGGSSCLGAAVCGLILLLFQCPLLIYTSRILASSCMTEAIFATNCYGPLNASRCGATTVIPWQCVHSETCTSWGFWSWREFTQIRSPDLLIGLRGGNEDTGSPHCHNTTLSRLTSN